MINIQALIAFIQESNMIEGIFTSPTSKDVEAYLDFLQKDIIEISDVEALVRVLQPEALLREHIGLDVYVGQHRPISGGTEVVVQLQNLLLDSQASINPFEIHVRYEKLHPFTDGNGRSGRALWLRMMQRIHGDRGGVQIGFLHQFYYQTLHHFN